MFDSVAISAFSNRATCGARRASSSARAKAGGQSRFSVKEGVEQELLGDQIVRAGNGDMAGGSNDRFVVLAGAQQCADGRHKAPLQVPARARGGGAAAASEVIVAYAPSLGS